MDDKTQKERLEQELRFLKESFEAEVISKEEFEKGKERIEKKLKEIKQLEEKEQVQKEEPKETKTEEKIKLNVIQEEHKIVEPIQIKEEPEPTPEISQTEIKPAKIEDFRGTENAKHFPVEEKGKNKLFKYAVVFVILVLVVFFSYSFLKENKKVQEKFVAACNSNEDCKQPGKEGICIASGTKDAKCEFREIPKTNVIVLNDRKNCFNCDTRRVLSILEEWFGPINAKEIDFNTGDGKNIAEKFGAKLLPLYILDENITKKQSFEQFKQVFVKKDNSYVLNDDAAGSTFYFKRDNVPNKLDLFVISGDSASIKAEKNLKEFLDTFEEMKFEKHFSNDNLTKELDIKTFPTFLINNKVKFTGIHTSDAIKNNFCKLNKLKECEKSLSKSLI